MSIHSMSENSMGKKLYVSYIFLWVRVHAYIASVCVHAYIYMSTRTCIYIQKNVCIIHFSMRGVHAYVYIMCTRVHIYTKKRIYDRLWVHAYIYIEKNVSMIHYKYTRTYIYKKTYLWYIMSTRVHVYTKKCIYEYA